MSAATVIRNLDAWEGDFLRRLGVAAGEIATLLENYAKNNHGKTPRSAGWVYPGGARRWRGAGIGWGDVTGNLNNSTNAEVTKFSRELVEIVLSAGMEYAVFVELAKSGRWAWLWPAVEDNKDEIMSVLRRNLSV